MKPLRRHSALAASQDPETALSTSRHPAGGTRTERQEHGKGGHPAGGGAAGRGVALGHVGDSGVGCRRGAGREEEGAGPGVAAAALGVHREARRGAVGVGVHVARRQLDIPVRVGHLLAREGCNDERNTQAKQKTTKVVARRRTRSTPGCAPWCTIRSAPDRMSNSAIASRRRTPLQIGLSWPHPTAQQRITSQ